MTTEKHLPLLDHLREIKKRLTISALAIVILSIPSFFLYETIVAFLMVPFQEIGLFGNEHPLIMTHLFEGFLIKLKLSILCAIILSLPVHLFNLIRFTFPGLKSSEKKVIGITLVSSIILSIASLYFGYTKVIPLSIQFLTSLHMVPDTIGIMLTYKDNIFYIFNFLLYGVITFQLPIVLVLLMFMNLIKRRTLLNKSRYIIIAIFALSAIITPPDVVSQLSIAIPLIGLFFLSILIAKIFRFGEE